MADEQTLFYVQQVTYEVWPKHRAEYLAATERVRDWALEIGAVAYYVLEDDDQANRFTEMFLFDSWSHFKRVQGTPLSPTMAELYDALRSFTIGGDEGTTVAYFTIREGGWA
jgi:quinol monooxygenase YgiN